MVNETVAQARRSRGMSVDDVAAVTSLRPLIIEAIEAGDFEMSGGEAYVVGHLRMIAKAVGLEPDDVVAEFRDETS